MFAFNKLKNDPELFQRLAKTYPFVEIYLDPLNDYRITWYYPHELPAEVHAFLNRFFKDRKYIEDNEVKDFLLFVQEAPKMKQLKIRPEVQEKIRKAWDKEMLRVVSETEELDFSLLKTTLFPYQKEGVKFATFRDAAILADEMGLGKTIQSIATAVMKKKLFGFRRTLVICPASLKEQWKKEIIRFSDETAVVIDGPPLQRHYLYSNSKDYFLIVNYETVLRDWKEINKMDTDFIILDEAQKIKNFNTATAQGIKSLTKKHALVITGTPIENRLTDLYSIVQFVDPEYLSPLWEFSYQHCYFDRAVHDKITGYYNLQQLNEKLKPILLRREKKTVLKDLPQVIETTIPVTMHREQSIAHAGYASGIDKILSKKFLTPFDLQRLMLLMNNMRMVCDSTFLIDKETHFSPKLIELEDVLLNKIDILKSGSKVIIFSEWVTMLQIIGRKLREWGVGFAMLTGKVSVKNRDALVRKFEDDPDCLVFLSTEAGGSGLNLQVADTVINFEIPWNPAKKNQRIGRIDRLGQRSKLLNVINFITKDSIEVSIASGLGLKQNLFEGVLNEGNVLDEVDFSASGKAQFLQQMQELIGEFLSEDNQINEIITDEEEAVHADTTETGLNIFADSEDEELNNSYGQSSEEKLIAEGTETIDSQAKYSVTPEVRAKEIEAVMNHGMDFLSGLLKMATGNTVGLEGRRMEFDEKTGEVVMRFRLPT